MIGNEFDSNLPSQDPDFMVLVSENRHANERMAVAENDNLREKFVGAAVLGGAAVGALSVATLVNNSVEVGSWQDMIELAAIDVVALSGIALVAQSLFNRLTKTQ